MGRVAPAAGSIEAWLRTKPKAIYRDDPHKVLSAAHDLYGLTCSGPVSYGEFVDHLWARGIQPKQVGARFWLTFGG